MQSTTTYSRGEIVYVPFRFTDRDKLKVRPAVVISSDAFHASRKDVIIAGITSNITRAEFVGQTPIENWAECGLLKPSVVSGILQTLRDTQIRERLGKLSASDQVRLDSSLRQSLAL